MSNTQQLGTLNFLVPATGETNVTAITLPNSDIGSTDPYSIDWLSLNSFIQGQLFIPQACTIIAVDVDPSVTIDFEIAAIGFKRTILGGTSPTFQFPALQNLVTSVTPSDGTSSFVTQWYNYPALPDAGESVGTVSGSVVVTSLPPVRPAGSNGIDYSSAPPALAANLLLTIPINTARNGYVVQNQSADQIQVVMDDGAGGNATIFLLAGAGADAPGGSLNASGMPHWGRIRAYGPNAGAQVAAHDW